jgi:hypothetical protein
MASWGIWAFLAFYFWESILGFIALLHLCYHFRRYFFLGIRCINTFLLSIKALISHPLFFLRLLLVIARQLCYEVFESALTAWYLYGGYQIDSLISCLSKKQKKRDEQIEKVREGGLVQVEVRVRKSSRFILMIQCRVLLTSFRHRYSLRKASCKESWEEQLWSC